MIGENCGIFSYSSNTYIGITSILSSRLGCKNSSWNDKKRTPILFILKGLRCSKHTKLD